MFVASYEHGLVPCSLWISMRGVDPQILEDTAGVFSIKAVNYDPGARVHVSFSPREIAAGFVRAARSCGSMATRTGQCHRRRATTGAHVYCFENDREVSQELKNRSKWIANEVAGGLRKDGISTTQRLTLTNGINE